MSQPEFSEEELRQLEAEMERITVDDVLIQSTVTLLNLAARKAGLGAPGSDPGRPPAADWEQVRQAIEGARALLPLLESRHAEKLGPIRDTLARLQLVYAQRAGGQSAEAPEGAQQEPGEPQQPGGPGPAQSTGRLWVPGQ
jgi:hypothetical protein